MLRTKDAHRETLTREEAARFLDACRDGDISEGEARRLVEAIRAEDETSAWILDELELSGMIGQAVDSTDADSFLRGFLELVRPDAETSDFAEATRERLAAEAARPNKEDESVLRGMAPAVQALRRGHDGTLAPRAWRIPKGPAIAVGVAIAALLAVAIVSQLWSGRRATLTLIRATPGVTIDRDDGHLPGQSRLPLVANDVLHVPVGGAAVLGYEGDQTWMTARSLTDVQVEPSTVPVFGDTAPDGQKAFISRELFLDVSTEAKPWQLVVFSPHVRVEVGTGKITLSVTPTSSRVDVRSGTVRVQRSRHGSIIEMGPGEDRVITRSGGGGEHNP